MSTILPPLSFDEALEYTKIHSIAGLIPTGTALIPERLFKFLHHLILQSGLVGDDSISDPVKYHYHTMEFYFFMSFRDLPEQLSNYFVSQCKMGD